MVFRRKVYRVKDPGSCVVRDPAGTSDGLMVPLDPSKSYSSSDRFVKAYPQLFVCDADATEDEDDSAVAETATAAPGEQRRLKR